MPRVKRGEKRSGYLGRCITEVMKEGKGQKAAVGKCEGMYDFKRKGKKEGKKGGK